jgi:hypothetical protein
MNLRRLLLLTILSGIHVHANAQRIATFDVDASRLPVDMSDIASIDLDQLTFLSDTILHLVEVDGTKRTEVPYQIEHGESRKLYWIVRSGAKTKKRTYELVQGVSPPSKETVKTTIENGGLVISTNSKKLLRYQFETMYPPSGVDTAYKRSGFIHPLWSPHGQVLTRIQPPDHYHHYGIWNPWTHVLFEGDTVDFWNIKGKQGTVRFANFTSITNGSVFGEYRALHEHVAFKKNGSEKIALNEIQSVRIYNSGNPDYYVADITTTMNCASPSEVLLLEYRYGGLGWRTTEQWDNKNSTVLTSEGKARKDADGSTARWCIVQGTVDGENAGVVMMSYPTNYNYPEPLRIWPENQYNRGDMFANFSPTKNRDWLLKPGHDYTLKYRLLVFNGNMTKEKAENAWQQFSKSPEVTVTLNKSTGKK